jgi:hypothetical protein
MPACFTGHSCIISTYKYSIVAFDNHASQMSVLPITPLLNWRTRNNKANITEQQVNG